MAGRRFGTAPPAADSGYRKLDLGTRDPARTLTVDVTGVRTLTLRVTDAGDGTVNDRASWADARIRCG